MRYLIPCPGCARHVFSDAPRCPFCSADVPTDVAAPRPLKARLGRAALFVAGAALAAACSSEAPPTNDGAPDDTAAQGTGGAATSVGTGGFQIGPLYGSPAIGSGGQGTGGAAYGAGGRGTGGAPDGTGGTTGGT